MKIYIAGKYTGLGHANACAKFAHTKQQLMAAGIAETDIVNPMELGIDEHENWATALEICLHHMLRCHAVFFQYDWRESQGAILEHAEATDNGLTIFYEEGYDDLAQLAAMYHANNAVAQVFTYATGL